MQFNFSDALRQLGPNAAFRLINEARPPASYLFAQFLPERLSPSYAITGGSLSVRALMAGLVGMDSPYPEATALETSTFNAQSAKTAHRIDFPEAALRTLQDMVQRLQIAGGQANAAVVDEVLNFTNRLLVQPQLDVMEYLRGQALTTGAIDWTFNQKRLQIDYGVPVANKLAARTGTAAYNGTASAFWDDVRAARRLLRGNVRAFVASPDTVDVIVGNPANNIMVLAESPDQVTVRRMITQNGVNTPSPDSRDALTIIRYGLEGEVIDLANPGQTIRIPFIKPGIVTALGNDAGTRYVVGAGSNPPNDYELGFTHIAPTVEGGGALGRWSRVYTMQNRPWSLTGEAVTNGLPVVESPDKIVIMTTAMPA